jgi:hypothetical protein
LQQKKQDKNAHSQGGGMNENAGRIGRGLLFAMGLAFSAQSHATGAIAIDSAKGSRWGVAYDHPNMASAERAALGKCGAGCKVVLRFPKGCGAYAVDRAQGSTSIRGPAMQSRRRRAANWVAATRRQAVHHPCVGPYSR